MSTLEPVGGIIDFLDSFPYPAAIISLKHLDSRAFLPQPIHVNPRVKIISNGWQLPPSLQKNLRICLLKLTDGRGSFTLPTSPHTTVIVTPLESDQAVLMFYTHAEAPVDPNPHPREYLPYVKPVKSNRTVTKNTQDTPSVQSIYDFCKSTMINVKKQHPEIVFTALYSLDHVLNSTTTLSFTRQATSGFIENYKIVPRSLTVTLERISGSDYSTEFPIEFPLPKPPDMKQVDWSEPYRTCLSKLSPVIIGSTMHFKQAAVASNRDLIINAHVVIQPVLAGPDNHISGILVLGFTAHLPFNGLNPAFAHPLLRHISSGLLAALSCEQDSQVNKESCRRFNELYNEMFPTGLITIDASNLTLNYCNRKCSEITGFKALMTWKECCKLVEPGYLSLLTKFFQFSSVTEEHIVQVRLENGRLAEFKARLIQEQTGFQTIIGCVMDITEQRDLEILQRETAEQRIKEVEEHRRQQEHFIDLTSHELRNPLSAVWQNAECLAESIKEQMILLKSLLQRSCENSESIRHALKRVEEDEESVKSILVCTSHQTRIANDILNVSKLNGGMFEIIAAPYPVRPEFEEVLRMFSANCRKNGINLSVDWGTVDADSALLVDGLRINQVLINLFTNAVKYTLNSKKKEITVQVNLCNSLPSSDPHSLRVGISEAACKSRAATCPEDTWFTVGVRDSGKGISREDLKKVFKRFSQVNPQTDEARGSGLGLYISMKLIEFHNGYLEVSSELEKGTIFTFVIPSPKLSVKQGAIWPAAPSHPNLCKRKRPGDSRISVLIVEDNYINQQVLKRQLESKHMQVAVANNGREGLDLLLAAERKQYSDTEFDIILMDNSMPVMTGLEAVAELRRLENDGTISKRYPVFAITGNARQSQIDGCIAVGFDKVFTKPYKISELVEQIQQVAS